MKAYHQALVDIIKRLGPGTVLDAASGPGPLGGPLEEAGFKVFSMDLYEAPQKGNGFVRADLNRTLPFRNNVFDYIICSEALQYLENHAMPFREFKRVLKDRGSIFITLPNILNASSRFFFLRRGYFPHLKPLRTVDEHKRWDSVTYNPVSLVEVLGLAGKNGLRVSSIKATGLKRSGIPLYILLRAFSYPGLFLNSNSKKAELLRCLYSKEVLLGDHLIIQMEKHRQDRC